MKNDNASDALFKSDYKLAAKVVRDAFMILDKNIKRKFIKNLKSIDVGLSDVIYKCENTTKSKDETIIEESIEYNPELKGLTEEQKKE